MRGTNLSSRLAILQPCRTQQNDSEAKEDSEDGANDQLGILV
jgi:hypothetical protein